MKNSIRTCTVLMICLMMLCSCDRDRQSAPDERTGPKILEETTRKLQRELPKELGPGVVWITSKSEPNLTLVHIYEFSPIAPIQDIRRNLDGQRKTIIRTVCNDQKTRWLLENNITIVYRYFMTDGSFITDNSVSTGDC